MSRKPSPTRAIESGLRSAIRSGSDYIPDIIEKPLRDVLSMPDLTVPRKATTRQTSLATKTEKAKTEKATTRRAGSSRKRVAPSSNLRVEVVKQPLPEVSPFAITGRADVGAEVMRKKAEQMELDTKARIQPSGSDPVFDLSAEAYEETPRMFEQSDPLAVQNALPRLEVGAKYPAKDRVTPLIERTPEIADRLAELAQQGLGTSREYFYHTAPIVRGLQNAGASEAGAMEYLQKQFAPAFAGTSPRTNTEQNLRNATMLNYLRLQGVPIDERLYNTFGNARGYNMMGSHQNLAGDMFRGAHNPMTNPKPSAFLPNTAGDLSHVTADTHNIRGALKVFNDLYPGELPPDWLYPKARAAYADTGEIDFSKDIDDSLRSASRGGVETQVEYGPIADITFEAARRAGIAPAPMQSLGWFGMGSDTGLVSAPKTIAELMNERVNVTAQALGIPPLEVLRLLYKGGLPLMAKGGAVKSPFAVQQVRR